MGVLYAGNAKKEPAATKSPRLAEKPLSVTGSAISISELPDIVNRHFPTDLFWKHPKNTVSEAKMPPMRCFLGVFKTDQQTQIQTIGFRKLNKLVFVAVRPKLSVIANQSADWCGNPPVEWNQVTITTKNRYVFPLCSAIVDTFPF